LAGKVTDEKYRKQLSGEVIVKLWPGKSEQQKTRMAEAITKDVMEILHYGDESVSVALKKSKLGIGWTGEDLQARHPEQVGHRV
jgi:phenylpyruvate tautomerase PptA (4-oxalocrotonate tautomerase family)